MLLNVLNHAGRAFKESEKDMIRKLPIEKSQKTWSLTTEARHISQKLDDDRKMGKLIQSKWQISLTLIIG